MTSEEAKERICDILEEATSGSEAVCYVTSDDEAALKMAINALNIVQIVEQNYDIHRGSEKNFWKRKKI